ncbi:MAG: hypothetical protein ACTSSJ_02110 [Candidatus Odinarchaeia archaeon]
MSSESGDEYSKLLSKVESNYKGIIEIREYFKKFISIVGEKFGAVNATLKKIVDEVHNSVDEIKGMQKELGSIKEIFEGIESKITKAVKDSINGLRDEINELTKKLLPPAKPVKAPPKEAPAPPQITAEIKEPTPVAPAPSNAKVVNFEKPQLTLIADIFDRLESQTKTGEVAEALAKVFEETRDQLMKYIPYHPAYYEMAKVIRSLKKLKEASLTTKDIEQLLLQIEDWRERMIT